MMIDQQEFRAHTLDVVQDPGFIFETAQVQAKALLSEISDEVPAYNWRYIPHRLIRNAVISTFQLEMIASTNPENIDSALASAARKFALVWESLARLKEGTSEEAALINAAVNYEIAGYQANAMYIARQLRGRQGQSTNPSLLTMAAEFLQRRLILLRDMSKMVQIEPTDEVLDEFTIDNLGLALAGVAFMDASSFLLRGDRLSLKHSMEFFEKATEFYASLGLVAETNLTRSIRNLLPLIERRTTWTLLADFATDSPKWQRYQKLLARGLGSDIYRARSVSELWPSQIGALQNGLLDSQSNKIIRMPTSSGKTRIAELAIVHTLITQPSSKCIYIAPYRALVSEVEQSLLGLLSDLGFRGSAILGTYESDEFEELLFQQTDVVVTTPEKLDLLLRAHPEFLENVKLLVLDEAHILDDKRRGMKFELLLERLRRKLPDARLFTISAVIPESTLESFATWLNASLQDDVMVSEWRPSIQRYAKFEWLGKTGVIRYMPDKELEMLQEFVPGVIRQQQFEYRNPDTGYMNHQTRPEITHRAQVAAELAYKFAELGPVLIFCSQPRLAVSIAKALYERIELSRLIDESISHYFQTKVGTRSSLLAREWLGNDDIATWLETGIGIHHGQLPNALRGAIETDFKQKNLRVMVATNTLAQGVNLPIRTVIIHSCKRYDQDTQQQKLISARDYWNIAGRAGRAGEETEGLVIHLNLTDGDSEDIQHYLQARENVEPVESALYQRLMDLVNERVSVDTLKGELDSEILALLVEENSDLTTQAAFNDLLRNSLLQIQATHGGEPIAPLSEVLAITAQEIINRVPNAGLRATYCTTGLSSGSCEIIRTDIKAKESQIRTLLTQANPEDINSIVDAILATCLVLAEMQTDHSISGSYGELMKEWINGADIQVLIEQHLHEASSRDVLGRLIDDLAQYKLPWGIAAYLRIAANVLDLDRNSFPDVIKFLPSMMKFGLPDPVACWAMAAGVPVRRTALELASAFRREKVDITYQSFLNWLSTLSSERLHHEFKLISPLLEDVSRAISNASINPLLQNFTTLEAFLPHRIWVRGIRYENRSALARRAELGNRVVLQRDYDNLIDRNAIKIMLNNQMLGHVPKREAQILAPELDTGVELVASIVRVDLSKAVPRIGIGIRLS